LCFSLILPKFQEKLEKKKHTTCGLEIVTYWSLELLNMNNDEGEKNVTQYKRKGGERVVGMGRLLGSQQLLGGSRRGCWTLVTPPYWVFGVHPIWSPNGNFWMVHWSVKSCSM
jgi:hypothetical protein